jgi:hypothetical protein
VDYSLFMAVMMVLTSVRVEKRPGMTPAAFPPRVFIGTTSVSVFRVSPPPPITIVEGGGRVYISMFLGQAGHLDTKMDGIGGPRLKQA